jgi:hypothetical protein
LCSVKLQLSCVYVHTTQSGRQAVIFFRTYVSGKRASESTTARKRGKGLDEIGKGFHVNFTDIKSVMSENVEGNARQCFLCCR